MLVDEIADASGKKQHEHQGDDDGGNHYTQMFGHPDRRDDRVQRENNVEQQNLHDHGGEPGRHATGDFAVLAFKLVVDFMGAFPKQEQAAKDENEVAARYGMGMVEQAE